MRLQTVGKNSAFIFAGTMVNMVTTLIFVPILARYLGVDKYGTYTYIYAFVGLFEAFASFGTYAIFTREVARHSDRTELHFWNALLLRLMLTGATFGIILLASRIFVSRGEWLLVAICAGEVLIRRLFSLAVALFRANQRMEYEFVTTATDRLVAFAAVIAAVRLDLGLPGVFAAFLVGAVAASAVGMALALRKFVRIEFQRQRGIMRWYLRSSWALGLAGEASMLYNRIGTVLLGQLASAAQVGIYAGAYRMYWFGASRAAESITQASFPALSKESQNPHRFRKAFWRMFGVLAAGSVAAGIGLWLVSPWVVNVLLGPSFEPSAEILRWMCIAVPFTFLSSLYGVALQASDAQGTDAIITVSTLVAMLALNVVLIPRYGAMGAAWAFVAGEVVATVSRAVIFQLTPTGRLARFIRPVRRQGFVEAEPMPESGALESSE